MCRRGSCFQMIFVAGKAFFITNLEPIMFWEFVYDGLGYRRPLVKLPVKLASHVLAVVSWMCIESSSVMCSFISPHFIVKLFSTSRTFSCLAAHKQLSILDIRPSLMKEGISLTVGSSSHLAQVSSLARLADFNETSKADKLLGSGQDGLFLFQLLVLLWRDEKRTSLCFVSLAMLFYWFLLSGSTFVSSLAKLLRLGTVFIFVNGMLPYSM